MEQQYNQTTDLFTEDRPIYGGFWERFGAAFIDGIILLIPNLLLTYMMPGLGGSLISLIIGWLYSAVMESGEGQATFGKRAPGWIC